MNNNKLIARLQEWATNCLIDGMKMDRGEPTLQELLADAAARLQGETGLSADWQPIETAPRGGKWVLVWWPEITDCALVAYRGPGGWRCPVGSGYLEGDTYGHPTHWMSLPAQPGSSKETCPHGEALGACAQCKRNRLLRQQRIDEVQGTFAGRGPDDAEFGTAEWRRDQKAGECKHGNVGPCDGCKQEYEDDRTL